MCGLICEPSPRIARPPRERLQVPADVGQVHRAARERDRDRGGELEPLGVLGREREREERVVRALERVDAVVAQRLDLARDLAGTAESAAVTSGASTFTTCTSRRERFGRSVAAVNSATYGSGSPSQRYART